MSSIALSFEEYGDPQASPLIILHGFLASVRNWRSIAQLLAPNYRILVPDLRHHGASPKVGSIDYLTLADDVLEFMDQQQLDSVHLLGHSMGGKVAMCVALQHPERIKSLIVADISPLAYQHNFDRTFDALLALPLQQLSSRAHAEQLLEPAFPELLTRQFYLQNLMLQDGQYFWRLDLHALKRDAHFVVGFPDIGSSAFSGKSLFLAGERSPYVQPRPVYRWFPQAKIQIIANTGHWLHAEAPLAFVEAVNGWLLRFPRE
jgi:esterase